jgi:hypothetical protein
VAAIGRRSATALPLGPGATVTGKLELRVSMLLAFFAWDTALAHAGAERISQVQLVATAS